MMSVTTAFLRGEVAAANLTKKKAPPAWKHHERGNRSNFDKRPDFKNQHKSSRRQYRFTPLIKTPKEILAMDIVKFKAPPPMTRPAENQNKNKFCEFHGDKGHNTDECIHLRRQIEEAVKSGQLSHLVKEIKQGGRRGEQAKVAKKGEFPNKEKATAIFMVQLWQRITKQKTTQSFSADQEISFLTLEDDSGQETPIVIETEVEGHLIHRMYVDGGSASEVPLTIQRYHRSSGTQENPSGLIYRSWNDKIPVEGGIVTIRSNIIMPAECRMVAKAQSTPLPREPTATEGVKVSIHPEHPKQTITIGENLSEKGRMELCNLLKENLDIFAWKPADMTGVPRHIAEHRLNVREGCQPVRQKRRGQAPDRNKAIQEEVAKLMEAEIMREVHYHDWLSNPVMIDRNLEVYVDDLVIKSHTKREILRDIEETFHNLRKINMKLNPKKCTFGAEEGAFLGHVVSMQVPIQICGEVTPLLQDPQNMCEKSDFQWTPEAKKAFQSMKECIAELPMVTAPKPREELIIRALQAPEINYNPMEKVVLALVHATRRLRRYFQAHLVAVVTDQPIKQIMSRPGNTGRTLKWKFELEVFDITYRPRTSIRAQVLADFIAKKPDKEEPPAGVQTEEAVPEPWVLFTDGSSCLEGLGAGLILTNPEGKEFTYALRFEFDASNNEAEYEALVPGLRAEQMGVKNLIAKVDSRLVASQINGLYEAKEQSMTQYLEKSRTLIGGFKKFSIEQVLVETLKRKSIEEKEIIAIVEEEGYCWMTPLVEYLTEGTLLAKTKKARAIKIKARQYAMINGVLYKKSFLKPWLRCVGLAHAEYVVREIHEGSCNMHSGLRSVVAKWGIDISGPFWEGQGKVKFLIVAIDYFTKWIEAKPVATITGNQVKKFVWDNIVCRFGLPGEIISDNGKQFRDNPFKDWCEKL
ncbi:reverse transcriptase domain-containing protein [Tanacetum coccineum]|uniref:Reverse transcriptase domain-containing protein n=1 Tax=Tanacetum coccineum TaxID=301880 RepID=A0ABQ5GRN7_9ASTR